MSQNAAALQRGKKAEYKLGNYSPDWERKLELLALVGTGREISVEYADPVALKDLASWENLLARLKTIQKQQRYRPGWVIHQTLACGNPPYWVLVELAENAGFVSDQWANKQWAKCNGEISPTPNTAAIDWAKWEKPVDRGSKVIVLKRKPQE